MLIWQILVRQHVPSRVVKITLWDGFGLGFGPEEPDRRTGWVRVSPDVVGLVLIDQTGELVGVLFVFSSSLSDVSIGRRRVLKPPVFSGFYLLPVLSRPTHYRVN